jgi:hypothetical protein
MDDVDSVDGVDQTENPVLGAAEPRDPERGTRGRVAETLWTLPRLRYWSVETDRTDFAPRRCGRQGFQNKRPLRTLRLCARSSHRGLALLPSIQSNRS